MNLYVTDHVELIPFMQRRRKKVAAWGEIKVSL